MDDLLAELGIQNEETEKYVYLDSPKEDQTQISLNIHINIFPSTVFQLNCSPK